MAYTPPPSGWQPQSGWQPGQNPRPKPKPGPIAKVIIVVVGLGFGIYIAIASKHMDLSGPPADDTSQGVVQPETTEPETSEAPSTGSDTMAFVQCKNFVEDKLKAPSTADWPLIDFTASYDGTSWTVTSYVDAQNSFGAMIRSEVRCVMTVDGDVWTPIEVTIT